MTLSTTTTRVAFPGAGTTGPFAFPFRIFDPSTDLLVIKESVAGALTTLTYVTDYTVVGVASGLDAYGGGGNVTLVVALAVGETLIIRRVVAVSQPTSLQNAGPYFASTIESALDRLAMIEQQLDEQRSVSPRAPASVDPSTFTGDIGNWAASAMLAIAADELSFVAVPPVSGVLPYYPIQTGEVGVTDTSYPVGHLHRYGARGNNVTNDTTAFYNMASSLQALGGGIIQCEPNRTYFILPTGGAADDTHLPFANITGLTWLGKGSTIRAGNVNTIQTFLSLNNCHDVRLWDLTFESGYAALDYTTGMDWVVPSYGTSRVMMCNVHFQYGRSGLSVRGIRSGEGTDANRAHSIVAFNVTAFGCYYPFLFATAGDNFLGRGLVTNNCGRAYFPQNVHDHDVEISVQQGGPFSAALLKVYSSTTYTYNALENIHLKIWSQGRYPGSGAEAPDEALVAMDLQFDTPSAPGAFRNVNIDFNFQPVAVDTNTSLFVIRKYNADGSAGSAGSGHIIDGLRLRGTGRALDLLTGDAVRLFTRAGEDWTGDFIYNMSLEDITLLGSAAQNAVTFNGLAVGGVVRFDNVFATGNIVRSDSIGPNIAYRNVSFNNFKAPGRAPQGYAPSWTAASVNPAIGNGSISGYYTVEGKMCTAQIIVNIGSTTALGTGAYSFGLPLPPSGDVLDIVGQAAAFRTGTNYYSGVALCGGGGGGQYVNVILGGVSASLMSGSVPVAWGAGDWFKITITYPVA